MKKSYIKIVALLAVVTVIGTLSSCRFMCKKGSGHVVSDVRKVNDFTRIDISGGYKVKLVQDSSLKVTINVDDNLLKYIETNVSGDQLRIHTRKKLCSSGEITITIGVRNLKEIEGSGALEITADSTINTKDIHFDMSGAIKIDMKLNAADVKTDGSGAIEMYLRGQAASHDVDVSGSSKIDALDFVVGKYNIEASGSNNCEINVLNSLNVNTSGSSNIEYRGNPTVNSKKSGASSITKIN